MLGAEDPLVVGEQRLVDRDRLLNAPGALVGGCEIVAGGERAGMRGAENPLAARRAAARRSRSPPPRARRPRRRRARLWRVVSVSGCSAPRIRSRSASSASNRATACDARPVCRYATASLKRALSVLGCSAPRMLVARSTVRSRESEPARTAFGPDQVRTRPVEQFDHLRSGVGHTCGRVGKRDHVREQLLTARAIAPRPMGQPETRHRARSRRA